MMIILSWMIVTIAAKKAKENNKPEFNRYLCESLILDGNDPGDSFFSLQFRWGRQFVDGDCISYPNQPSS